MKTRLFQQAYWLSSSIVAWNPAKVAVKLDDKPAFWLNAGDVRVEGGKALARHRIALEPAGKVAGHEQLTRSYPYLSQLETLISPKLQEHAAMLLREDLVLSIERADGTVLYSTGLQTFGVLDALMAYGGNDLGAHPDGDGRPVFRLWAPTAKTVLLRLYERSTDSRAKFTIAMNLGERGVWSAHGEKNWFGWFYLYEVEVFFPETGAVEKNLVTDPYSFSLSTDSKKSQVVDLADPKLKPEGWDAIRRPAIADPTDMVIYELHVRDFSSADLTVASEYRGKYLAFTEKSSLGMSHLKALAAAGLTHVHLLPVHDFATVLEDPAERVEPEIPVGLPPDSPEPQRIIASVKGKDAFNWGYDPFHYLVPEGCYATHPNGSSRVREFRAMVQGLHEAGLRVVMDVVFNHTYQGGLGEKSVFDKVVPGYYYRQNSDGYVENSAVGGCPDTATEHAMMGKLMVDALVLWARQYKVDGFRFDLMGHHSKASILAVRNALDALTLDKDGVEGRGIYLYGEGWKFGSLDAIMPDQACTQWNMLGTGVGTFNDRLRDKVRGGSFSHSSRTDQGFATGLFWDDNGLQGIKPDDQKNRLLQYQDIIRVGMAGNLRGYKLRNWFGGESFGDQVDSDHGSRAGYAGAPQETVNFVSAHDNYELWDQISAKAAFKVPGRDPETATSEERVRMQKIALAVVALGQGVPFFTAGSDFLRSKSGDGDSYDAGDWFNRLDFGLHSNNWGVGLPSEEKNGREWEFWAQRLREWTLAPSPEQMAATAEFFRGLLRVRKSSPLFRLRTLEEIRQRVYFPETELGMDQPRGFLGLCLRDDFGDATPVDAQRKLVFAAFNATRAPIRFEHAILKGRALELHRDWTVAVEPRAADASFDRDAGAVVVPPQTVLVYEERR